MPIFQGIKLTTDGKLSVEALMANMAELATDQTGGFSVGGLTDLLNYELLVDGLNEFLNFAIFNVRNTLETEAADKIVGAVRAMQAKMNF